MQKRSFVFRVQITIDNGRGPVRKWYTVEPLAVATLAAPFMVGYRLVGKSDTPSPVYFVRMTTDGIVNCDCPSWNREEKCKHGDALIAAGLLPVPLAKILAERSTLLNAAEAETQKIAEQASAEAVVHQHDYEEARERIAQLEYELRSVTERALQLQTGLAAIQAAQPARPRRPRKATAA